MSILVFPGQGSQSAKFKDAMLYPEVVHVLEKARNFLGFDVHTADSLYAPVALFIESVCILELYKARPSIFMGFDEINTGKNEITFVAGHSLGQYTAAVACGAITFDTGLDLIQRRTLLMAEAAKEHPGSMAACIGHNVEQVVRAILEEHEGVYIANYNSKNQIVISGNIDKVETVINQCKNAGLRCVKLNVAGAFHSPLMSNANEKMNAALEKVEFADPTIGFICNTTHEIVMRGDKIKADLHDQMIHPVQWVKTMEVIMSVYGSNMKVYEIGPGNVLSKLIQADSGIEVTNFESIELQKMPEVEVDQNASTSSEGENPANPTGQTDPVTQ